MDIESVRNLKRELKVAAVPAGDPAAIPPFAIGIGLTSTPHKYRLASVLSVGQTSSTHEPRVCRYSNERVRTSIQAIGRFSLVRRPFRLVSSRRNSNRYLRRHCLRGRRNARFFAQRK